MNYPVPDNENQRLEALLKLRILDTEDDQLYDTIVELAASVMEAPSAMITFMDSDRGFVKARKGFGAREGSREHSFCAHTIVDPNGSMLVNDTLLDKRFATNPWVLQDPKIRFYFGISLITPNNEAIGTICVIDSVARKNPTSKQIKELKYLSKLIMNNLELREHIFNIYDDFQKLKSLTVPKLNKSEINLMYDKININCDIILEKIKARKVNIK